ncbi:uncharacterized protein LOC129594736 [Paramacrobiotus metropolitanus]|uniref:uncharacterized protein LOC129594736 n=1 Tax=Paramacrobiotus metropolitanus TaxID=2943436 RepID=UPI0024459915|nr:uncharacterized protein LOC129594736 [Paramacrobiotus metropolitanus]
MAVFSRMGLNMSQPEQPSGEVKFCVFGLMLSTDSPKLLLLSVTCGVLSVTLLSTASRALLAALWRRSRQWLIKFLTNGDADVALPMGNVNAVVPTVSGVRLDTNQATNTDLWASYEIIDLPRIRPRMCDAQTSPLHAGSLARVVATEDRACSPCPMYGAASEEEDLLVFEAEVDREIREGEESLVNFDENPERDELHDRLMSLEKALQETHREMGQHMSSLSELSQRHFCSANNPPSQPVSSAYQFPPTSYQIHACHLHPLLTSSADPANGLVWEDEFTPERPASGTLHPDLQDLELWQSDLRFFSGLSGHCGIESAETSLLSETSLTASPTAAGKTPRDSGVMELWDVESEEERKENVTSEESSVCVRCAGRMEKQRPVSAPTHGDAGVVSSGVRCLSSGCSPLHQPATDRVPKRKVGKK